MGQEPPLSWTWNAWTAAWSCSGKTAPPERRWNRATGKPSTKISARTTSYNSCHPNGGGKIPHHLKVAIYLGLQRPAHPGCCSSSIRFSSDFFNTSSSEKSSCVKKNVFLPKSLSDAPKWYAVSSMKRNLSCIP